MTMYACGVTVYDLSHIGHARGAVAFDVIQRYFRRRGYQVTYVRNFTDVDDKIINRAKQEGITAAEVARKYIDAYQEDMKRLGVGRPDIEPLATEHIKEMIEVIQRLIEKGHAYAVDGDVYFRVASFKDYGKLSKRNLEDMKAGARVEVDERKDDPLDFALWKASKPGEPAWDSPWGPGRPGWHIECTAMGFKHLGETFDIHAGGKDLIFPHHENEIAQSEASSGKKFVNYWLHNGFVNINQEKMSKSLGNFFTIRDILDKYDAEIVRLFLLSTHYRSPIDFSDANLKDARAGLDRFYTMKEGIKNFLAGKKPSVARPEEVVESPTKPLYDKIVNLPKAFEEAMDDDFNTALAIGLIYDARPRGEQIHCRPGPEERAGGIHHPVGRAGVLQQCQRDPRHLPARTGGVVPGGPAWRAQGHPVGRTDRGIYPSAESRPASERTGPKRTGSGRSLMMPA